MRFKKQISATKVNYQTEYFLQDVPLSFLENGIELRDFVRVVLQQNTRNLVRLVRSDGAVVYLVMA
jgi:hypothetical protein